MSKTRASTFVLPALALTIWASAASAQLTAPGTVTLPSYTRWSETATSTTFSVTASSSTAYTATTFANWFSVACGGTATPGGDTCTVTVILSWTDSDGFISPYTNTISLNDGTDPPTTVTVNMPVVTPASPLTSTPPSVTLSYVSHGVANQSAAMVVASIASSDSSADSYSASGYANWLTVTPATGKSSSSGADACTFVVNQTNANALAPGTTSTTVHLAVFHHADLLITVTLTITAAQPLATTTTSIAMNYVTGGTLPTAPTAAITASSSVSFAVDPATVPVWLTVSPTSGTASASATTITLTPVGTVLKGLAAGNYFATIGFLAASAGSELTIPVVLTVSNTPATISLKGSATNTVLFNMAFAPTAAPPVPAPVITVISSDEPVSFSATCGVTSSNPTYVHLANSCTLTNGTAVAPTVTGIAYTFGTPLATTFDSALFATGTPYGTVITLTVTVTAGTQTPVVQTYTYTVEPVDPTFTALSPTSATQIAAGDSLTVTLTGSNFVGPGNIVTGSLLSPTRVFVGTTDVTTLSVVYSPTVIVVSIPQSDFLAYPTGKTTVNLVLGVANQTGSTGAPTAAKVTQNLVITTAPVVYAITSTATYNQPLPGSKPIVAPYELISIFGANFGATGPVNGTLSAFGQFGNTVNVSGAGTSSSPYVTLAVNFKVGTTTYPAPILFANANQINAIVPSGLTVGSTPTVTVTVGTTSSDGLFSVSTVVADPGIFTLSSQGVGQGAILNQNYSVNKPGNETTSGQYVSIYLTGLGAPNSTAADNSSNSGVYPGGCVAINNPSTTTGPGYLQVVNTTTKTAPIYTAPATPWTNIDGAVINSARLVSPSLAPCFTAAAATAVSVVLGSGSSTQTVTPSWAGFASGSVAGLYQINVTIPSGLAPSGPTTVPVQVILGTEGHSPDRKSVV